jgi:tetratricopeptide (TPR) repeat protein
MKKAVELSPRNETYQINLANMYMVNRKVDEAIALLRGLAGSGNHEVVSRANAALVQAENLKKQTAAREAEAREYQKDTEKATSLEQSSPDWHYNLGDALLSKGNLDSAIAEYRHAISLKPDFPEAHLNLGAALGHKRDLDGAIDEYREAIRLKPDLASAHLRLGDALVEKDNAGGGIAEYREAIRLKPDFVQAHRELGYELMFKGERVAALEELRKVLTFDPRDDVVRRDVEKLSLEAHDK